MRGSGWGGGGRGEQILEKGTSMQGAAQPEDSPQPHHRPGQQRAGHPALRGRAPGSARRLRGQSGRRQCRWNLLPVLLAPCSSFWLHRGRLVTFKLDFVFCCV